MIFKVVGFLWKSGVNLPESRKIAYKFRQFPKTSILGPLIHKNTPWGR
jgi:hypothetical protein